MPTKRLTIDQLLKRLALQLEDSDRPELEILGEILKGALGCIAPVAGTSGRPAGIDMIDTARADAWLNEDSRRSVAAAARWLKQTYGRDIDRTALERHLRAYRASSGGLATLRAAARNGVPITDEGAATGEIAGIFSAHAAQALAAAAKAVAKKHSLLDAARLWELIEDIARRRCTEAMSAHDKARKRPR